MELVTGPGKYEAVGTLTLRGAEAPVTLPFEMTLAEDQATMSGRSIIDRREYGVGLPAHPGESMPGCDVDLALDLTATRAEQARSLDTCTKLAASSEHVEPGHRQEVVRVGKRKGAQPSLRPMYTR